MEKEFDTTQPRREHLVASRLEHARASVLVGIEEYSQRLRSRELRQQILDYPLRPAKALRPALMFAAAEAFGSCEDAVLPAAVALELCHNAFLLHDDVEDHSASRRHRPAMHVRFGVSSTINAGDGMFALAMEPLLDCTETLGLGRTLRLLRLFSRMCIATARGQATELAWINDRTWSLTRADYVAMVHRKTAHYTFAVPLLVGAIAGRVDARRTLRLHLAAARLGVAFQIADDMLSVAGHQREIGKDALGDLYEGKRTLVLLETLSRCSAEERDRALAVLEREPPTHTRLRVQQLVDDWGLPPQATASILDLLPARQERSREDVQFLAELIARCGGDSAARSYAAALVDRSQTVLRTILPDLDSDASQFLLNAGPYALDRSH